MQRLWITQQFLSFYWSADTIYQLHSPFVYEFARQVLEDDRQFYAFRQFEHLRELLLRTPEIN